MFPRSVFLKGQRKVMVSIWTGSSWYKNQHIMHSLQVWSPFVVGWDRDVADFQHCKEAVCFLRWISNGELPEAMRVVNVTLVEVMWEQFQIFSAVETPQVGSQVKSSRFESISTLGKEL